MSAAERSLSSLFLIPLMLFIVGLCLFLALLWGQRDLIVLSLLLFGVASGAKLWSRWSMKGIACGVDLDRRRLFPGEKLRLAVTAENRKWLPVWLRVDARLEGLSRGTAAGAEVTAESGLLWHQRSRFQWELAARRRGVHRIGPLRVTSGDLFGFYPKTRTMADPVEVVVYPRLVPLRPLAVPRRDFFGIPGAKSPVQDPVYILGTRDYHHGRPAKHIHWKATARHHRLQEKIFEPSAQEKILLAIDVVPFARHGADEAFERLLEVAASAAVQYAERGCAVGLIANAGKEGGGPAILSAARSPGQMTALLETLARVRMEPGHALPAMLRLHPRLPSGLTCLYFSQEMDETARLVKEYCAQRRSPFFFFPWRSVAGLPEAEAAAAAKGGGDDRCAAREGRG